MNARREFTITKLERDDGYWRAHVTENSVTYRVHRQFGSWMRDGGKPGALCEVPKDWAFALQDRVRPVENAERREREKAAA